MERLEEISSKVKLLSNKGKGVVLEFIVGYMFGSNQGCNKTDGYVAFMEGMESAIIEYSEE